MKANAVHDPTVPNIFKDEEGSVMTEFLIVAPFLFTIVFGIFFYTDLNRFSISTHEHSYIQAWKSVAMGKRDLSPSDKLVFSELSYAGINVPAQLLGFADMRLAMITYPPLQGGDVRAGLIYSANNMEDMGSGVFAPPYDYQGMPVNTYDKREFSLDVVHGAGPVTYKNSTYLTPLWGAANSFIGKRDQQGASAYNNPASVTLPARQSIMSDPYSVYWHIGSKRLRYADRFTIMRDPIYAVAGLVQTVISGKLGIINEIPTILDDLGYTTLAEALSWLDNPVFEFIGDIVDIILKEQAEPFRKLDKRMDQSHDVNGNADFGQKTIRSQLRLQSGNSNRWTSIQ